MILLFGPQGSGKGTQAELLAKRNGWRWLSTGQMFRDSQDPEVNKRLELGELIDDKLTDKVLYEALRQIDSAITVILDGYPRNASQAQWLLDSTPKLKRSIVCMIELDVPEEESVRRLLARGRADDNPAAIRRRLQIYHEETEPVIDFYRKKNIPLYKVNGIGTVEEIHERMRDAVESCVQK